MTSSTPRTVLVLGANGRLGAAAVRAFAHAGWRVLAQVRRAPAAALPRGAEALAMPMSDPHALAAAATGASVVLYAINSPCTRWASDALPLLRQGLEASRRLPALFMLPGNIYSFGEAMPALLQESTPEAPSTANGRVRSQMEAELLAATAHGQRSVVLRAGDFFGAGTGSWLDQLVAKDLARGRLTYPGPLDRPHAWAYLPDLARAFVAVAAADFVAGTAAGTGSNAAQSPPLRKLHFAGHTLTGAQLLRAAEVAAGELGLHPARGWRHGGMPWGFVRLGGLVLPKWRDLACMSYLFRVPHALDGSALNSAVGALQHTPIVTALRQAFIDLGLAPAPTPAAT